MHQSTSSPLSWLIRTVLIASGVGALGLLVVASTLNPDDRGFGTHLQLGLAPCSIRTLYGIRCPACGMTTSWALAVRGQLVAAMETNTGGVVLAVVALVGGVGSVFIGIRGRWPNAITDRRLLAATLVVMASMLLDWIIRLAGS